PGCDLRQVGDDDDLGVAGEFGQAAADLDGGLASDSGVDLVEDVGGDGLPGRADDFDGEHDAGELTAAGDPADVVGHRRVVGGEGHPHIVGAVGGGFAGGDLEGHSGLGHGQGGQLLAHGRGELIGRAGADLGEFGGGGLEGVAGFVDFGVETVEV